MAKMMKTPGVYINELNAFLHSLAKVPTAIPAFIGYTPRASYEGKSYLNKPVPIRSFQDYQAFFGVMVTPPGSGAATAGPPSSQYRPIYFPVAAAPGEGDPEIDGIGYALVPDAGTLYYLYNSVRMFYENGGGSAYVVSVGGYGKPTGKAATTSPYVNPNVQLDELLSGLEVLVNEPDPTMLVIPDAVLLPADDNATLMKATLGHCAKMKSRVAIFDVIGGAKPDPELWTKDITSFRTNTGDTFLKYGIAYYPFIDTTIMQDPDISFLNVGGGVQALRKILTDAGTGPVKTILDKAQQAQQAQSGSQVLQAVTQAENALRIASQDYSQLHTAMLRQMNIQPPSATMAGIYTMVDNTLGVWKAPANVSITGAVSPTYNLSDAQQAGLNVDAMTGKSINSIRLFTGKGVLVWGARTLDGNSHDWRYINVRRTMIMIEQSAKLAIDAFVFEPNDDATWASVTSMLNNFLTDVWQQGGLAGSSAAEAFSVNVGLGKTMTATDILNGIMNVVIKVAVTRPAEFIVITISRQMQTS